jgi:hypothetical protein
MKVNVLSKRLAIVFSVALRRCARPDETTSAW